jgi:hypothetical protein
MYARLLILNVQKKGTSHGEFLYPFFIDWLGEQEVHLFGVEEILCNFIELYS